MLGSDKGLNGAVPCPAHQTPAESNCLFDENFSLPLIYMSPDGEGLQATAWLRQGAGLCSIGVNVLLKATGFHRSNREGIRTLLPLSGAPPLDFWKETF